MHRFYMFHSFSKFHRNTIAPACLFLAAKVEEQPRKLEHVVGVAHRCLHRDATAMAVDSEQYLEKAHELVIDENILLQTLGFDITVDHPHTHVVKTCQLVRASKDLAQTSYFLATNSLHLSMMCLMVKPTVVACVAIHLACIWSSWELPKSSEGKDWWWYVEKGVTKEMLEDLTAEFLNIIEKCPTKLKGKILTWKSGKREDLGDARLEQFSDRARSSPMPEPCRTPPKPDPTSKRSPHTSRPSSLMLDSIKTSPALDKTKLSSLSPNPAVPVARESVSYKEYKEKKERERLSLLAAKASGANSDISGHQDAKRGLDRPDAARAPSRPLQPEHRHRKLTADERHAMDRQRNDVHPGHERARSLDVVKLRPPEAKDGRRPDVTRPEPRPDLSSRSHKPDHHLKPEHPRPEHPRSSEGLRLPHTTRPDHRPLDASLTMPPRPYDVTKAHTLPGRHEHEQRPESVKLPHTVRQEPAPRLDNRPSQPPKGHDPLRPHGPDVTRTLKVEKPLQHHRPVKSEPPKPDEAKLERPRPQEGLRVREHSMPKMPRPDARSATDIAGGLLRTNVSKAKDGKSLTETVFDSKTSTFEVPKPDVTKSLSMTYGDLFGDSGSPGLDMASSDYAMDPIKALERDLMAAGDVGLTDTPPRMDYSLESSIMDLMASPQPSTLDLSTIFAATRGDSSAASFTKPATLDAKSVIVPKPPSASLSVQLHGNAQRHVEPTPVNRDTKLVKSPEKTPKINSGRHPQEQETRPSAHRPDAIRQSPLKVQDPSARTRPDLTKSEDRSFMKTPMKTQRVEAPAQKESYSHLSKEPTGPTSTLSTTGSDLPLLPEQKASLKIRLPKPQSSKNLNPSPNHHHHLELYDQPEQQAPLKLKINTSAGTVEPLKMKISLAKTDSGHHKSDRKKDKKHRRDEDRHRHKHKSSRSEHSLKLSIDKSRLSDYDKSHSEHKSRKRAHSPIDTLDHKVRRHSETNNGTGGMTGNMQPVVELEKFSMRDVDETKERLRRNSQSKSPIFASPPPKRPTPQ